MALDEEINFLDHIPTFHLLGREALRILAISAESIHVLSGDTLFEEGEPADGGYVVINGAIMLRSARDKLIGDATIVRPGTLIGEMALIVDTVRPVTAIATEPSTVLRIPRGVFMRMLESEAGAAGAMRALISKRVAAALDDLDVVMPLFDAPRGGSRTR